MQWPNLVGKARIRPPGEERGINGNRPSQTIAMDGVCIALSPRGGLEEFGIFILSTFDRR